MTDGSGLIDYTWNFGDGNTGSGENPRHTYTAVGGYTVVVTAVNSAGQAVAGTQVIVADRAISGLQAFRKEIELRLQPGSAARRRGAVCSRWLRQAQPPVRIDWVREIHFPHKGRIRPVWNFASICCILPDSSMQHVPWPSVRLLHLPKRFLEDVPQRRSVLCAVYGFRPLC
jgi:hypothetical protein